MTVAVRIPTAAAEPRDGARHAVIGGAVGVGVLVAAWAVLAGSRPELVLPSPAETWASVVDLARDGTLTAELARTLGRAVSGVAIGLVIGVVWGGLNGSSRWCAAVSRPAMGALMAVPPVVVVSLGLVWLGPGGSVTQMVVALVALPLIVTAVQEAVRAVDHDLLEMASTFELSRASTLRHLVAPAIASPVLAAVSVTLGQALRVAVMAELLSAADGVGAEVALARTNLATADLFAWALVLVAVVVVVETVVLRPLTAHLLRWRDASRH